MSSSRLAAIFRGDINTIRRDPTMLMLFTTPFLIGMVAGLLIPFAARELAGRFSFNLEPHYPIIISIFMMLVPLLSGTLFGLLFLEERDRGIQRLYAVTPLGRNGFFRIRFLLTLGWSVVFEAVFYALISSFIPLASPLTDVAALLHFILFLLTAAVQGAFILPILGLFARDRISGLAIIKLFGVTAVFPAVWYVLPDRWSFLLHLFYPVPAAHSFLLLQEGNPSGILYALVGLVLEAAMLFPLWRILIRAKTLPLRR